MIFIEFVQVFEVLSGMQAKIQAVLILLATGLKITKLKGGTQSEQQNCRASWRMTASVSTGLNARRAAGLTVPDSKKTLTRTESGSRGSREGRAAYEADKEAMLLLLVLLYQCKVLQSRRTFLHKSDKDFFSFRSFRFHLHCFCGAAVPCCCAFSFFVVHTSY